MTLTMTEVAKDRPQATLEDQIDLERQSVVRGYQRFMGRHEAQVAQGEGGETRVGHEVQYLLVGQVTGHIQALIAAAKDTRRRGRPPLWLPLVEPLDAEALALEALSAGWSAASMSHPLQKTLANLGDRAEVLAEVQALKATNGPEATRKALANVVQTKTSTGSRRKAVKAKAAKVNHEPWTVQQKVYVGGLLWNALCLTGLFETWEISGRDFKFTGLTTRGEHLALEAQHSLAWARPYLLPTLVPPAPWTGLHTGGYHTKELRKRTAFVRTRWKEHRKVLEAAETNGSLVKVMEAVSAIQDTAFSLSPEVLALVKWSWRKGLSLKKFPSRERVPTKLPWDLEYMDIREKARHLALHYRAVRYNRGISSNAAAMRRDLETADWLTGLPAFWLPHSLDFRGRVYPIPSFNHQRADHVKAMFRFSRGERLGPQGLRALKWHVANTGDFGKVSKRSWEQRVKWTEDNLALVLRVARDPKANLEWTKADKPFSFYHACLELSRALALPYPEDYVSSLPVDLDGSNSGVQHYAAMFRGPEGVLVNLTPSETPADVYAVVADKVRKYAEAVAADHVHPAALQEALRSLEKARGDTEATGVAQATLEPLLARLWLEYGVTRTVVKRSVMTRGYGSETYGFRNQLIEDLMEPLGIEVLTGKRAVHPFGPDEGRQAASWMAKRIWIALDEVLVATSAGMDYFQGVASALGKQGLPVYWTTRLGFPVVQRYEEYDTAVVTLWLYGREAEVPQTLSEPLGRPRNVLDRYRMTVVTGGKSTLVKHRQVNAVAPNFVHSQDATHLLMSVLTARDVGIRDFLLVHDSFATHASHIDIFGRCVRVAFVDLYANGDPVKDFHDQASVISTEPLPDIPEKGTLDIFGVLDAPYAFA
jgi:DNA-directed RNA polymerase